MKEKAGRKVAGSLGPVLADLVALSLQSKQAHWNVEGARFQPLHEMFDRMTDEYRGWYDEVAERMLALGEPADGRVGTLAKASGVEDLPGGRLRDEKAVALMLDRVEGVAGRIRDGLEAVGDLDPVTEDLLIGIVAGLEKQAWMLRAQKG